MLNLTPDTMVQWTSNGWAPLPEAQQKFNAHLKAIQPPAPPQVTNGVTRSWATRVESKSPAMPRSVQAA